MIKKYHNHKPQRAPWHREEERLNHQETPGRQIKQSNQLSIPHQEKAHDLQIVRAKEKMFLKGYPLEAKTAPKNWN